MSDIPTVSGPDYPMGDGPSSLPVLKGYKIIKQLGEGGMGIVYLAEQTEPIRRQVALKIVKPGMDSRAVIARFEAERQALAMLDHPNIAHVYDAGTTDKGRPYFVMEYIHGIPITDYCDQQELNIEERLELFKQVCEGIQHAHQRGIIHRDIKPSNILILSEEGKATPKVIDFGIAKAISQELTEQTMFTAQGQLLGTPEYMSPEQADLTSLSIDTRTDVYSLGVVLYQLLTGVLPFDPKTLRSAAFEEIQRIIKEVDPPKPSIKLSSLGDEGQEVAKTRKIALGTLTKKLHKELEWIPLKAMRKESEYRYQSVSELANDIGNYLSGSPLVAGPESRTYRIKKYIRRNRILVTSTALIMLVLIIGIVASTFFAVKAEKERVIAEQNRTAAEDAKEQEIKQRQIAEEEKFRALMAEKDAREKAELNRQQLYYMSINQAASECDRENILDAQELLENCPEDLREWEWFHLWKKTGNSKLIFSGDRSIVTSVTFSPDGTKIAWGKGEIAVWDIEKNTELMHINDTELWRDPNDWLDTARSFKVLTMNSVVFSPDSKYLASGKGDGLIKVWEVKSGKEILSITGNQDGVSSVAYSPNGKWLASGGINGTIKIWDAINGAEIKSLSNSSNGIYSVGFSPDGTRIVCGEQYGSIKIWNVEKAGVVVTFLGHIYPASFANSDFRDFGVESVAFSPDGKHVVSGGTYGIIKVWDAINGSEMMTLSDFQTKNIFSKKYTFTEKKETYSTDSVCFSPAGKSIISAIGDGTIRIWDAESGNQISVIYAHRGGVESLAVSPDGKSIASGGTRDGKIRMHRIKEEPGMFSFRGHKKGVESIDFSHDGSCIISGSRDGTVKIWSSKNHSLLRDISPRQIQITPNSYKTSGILSVAFHPNDTLIAVGDEDGMIRIMNPEKNTEILTLVGDKSGVNSIVFSPDGKKIISGEGSASNSGTVRMWDIDTGDEILCFSNIRYGVKSVAISPNGKLLAWSCNNSRVKMWDIEEKTEIMDIEGVHGSANSIAFSPDSTCIAVAHRQGVVKVWDIKNVAELTLSGFQGSIESLAFSPDGKRIISAGKNGTIKIWDIQTGSEVLTLADHKAEINRVAFSPDGTMIASGDADGIIKIWVAKSCDGPQANQKNITDTDIPEDNQETQKKVSIIGKDEKPWDIKLLTASKMGKIEAVRDAMANGAQIDCRDQYGCTPLQWAADMGYIDVVKVLLDDGADINAIDKQGKTALMWAAGSGQNEIAKLLLEKGSEFNAKDTEWGSTALMWAASKGHPEMVKILLEEGADINAKDLSGKTAMMWARSKKHVEIVRILQEKGAIE